MVILSKSSISVVDYMLSIISAGELWPESKYHSYELITLAVVNAMNHFRHYLQGYCFTVVKYCNSLKALRNKVDLTLRVHRW